MPEKLRYFQAQAVDTHASCPPLITCVCMDLRNVRQKACVSEFITQFSVLVLSLDFERIYVNRKLSILTHWFSQTFESLVNLAQKVESRNNSKLKRKSSLFFGKD